MTSAPVAASGGALPVPLPPYGRSSLAELVPAIGSALGLAAWSSAEANVGVRSATPPDPTLSGRALPDSQVSVTAATQVCLLLVDGLGERLLREHADLAPVLTGGDVRHQTLTTGFPSTTPTSLAMLGTGLPPGQHGLVGYRVFQPGLPVDPPDVLNLLQWHESLDPLAYQPTPTLFQQLELAGVDVVTVGPRAFRGSGLTVAALRGGRHLGADSPGELIAGCEESLRAGEPGRPRLVYAYSGELDATGHRTGPGSRAWREQLRVTDYVVGRLRDLLPPGTLLLVTGDHGMVNVPSDRRVDLAERGDLWQGVVGAAGEPRALTLRLHPNAHADEVAQRWNAALAPDFLALPLQRAAALYGPMTPAAAERAGDVLVLALADDVALIDSRHRATSARGLRGMHGALTDAERLVPLCEVLL